MLQSYESCFVLENVLRTWKDVDLGDDGTARTISALGPLTSVTIDRRDFEARDEGRRGGREML